MAELRGCRGFYNSRNIEMSTRKAGRGHGALKLTVTRQGPGLAQRGLQLADGLGDLLVLVAEDGVPDHLKERPGLAGAILVVPLLPGIEPRQQGAHRGLVRIRRIAALAPPIQV